MPFRRPKPVPSAALSLALSVLLTACGGGTPKGDTTPVPPATTYTASAGVAQKGPLALGSTVTARELGLNLSPTGNLYSYATTSATGAFLPNSTFASPLLSMVATGSYVDEVTGTASDGPVTLKAYANLTSESVLDVNVLTTLAYTRINTLLNTNGMTFAGARAQAEREVLASFGIVLATSPGAFGSLDVSANTNGGHILAALSSVIVQGRKAAQVDTLLTDLQADIGANGANISAANAHTLALSEQALNPNLVAAHVAAVVGSAVDAKGLAEWLDQDSDGVVAHDEFRVDDATPASTFALPADFVAARAGASVSLSAGQLMVNGAVATQPAAIHAGDSVAIAAPPTLADGALKVYLRSGSAPVGRVTFVKGLASIAITPTTGTLPVGISQRFVATGTYADGHSADITDAVTWASGTPAVANIGSTTGLANALTLGTTAITATSGSVNGILPLTTISATIQSMVIAPAALQTGVGVTRHFTATGTFSDGSVADVSASATWATQTSGIASVSNGAASGLALGSTSVTASIGSVSASATLVVTTNTWSAAPQMPTERVAGHTATLLQNGKLLVVGGVKSAGVGTAAADLFDSSSATWTSVAPMNVMRSSHAATLLDDGRLLVTGGSTVSAGAATGYVNNTSAEIYDPVANTWTAIPPMSVARAHHTATLMTDGKVLVVGGENVNYLVEPTAEIYDPVANTWTTPRVQPLSPRSQHAATLLPSGLVLITGGFDIIDGVLTPLATAELYDPVLHTTTSTTVDGNGVSTTVTTITGGLDFTATAPMTFPRYGQSATRLADGRVVVVGGTTTTTEIFDPVTATWTTQGNTAATHTSAAAVTLADGRLLVVGGTQFSLPTAELFDPATGAWTAAAPTLVIRSNPAAAWTPDGSVMVCGGAPDNAGVNCETFW
jgi:N-acetylneuraminic acid mutarotase